MNDESSIIGIDDGGGGTDINRSGTRKSCSWNWSVISEYSNVKPRSSAYVDRNSYSKQTILQFLLFFKTNSTLSLGIGASSANELFNCTLNDPSRISIKFGPHIWISTANICPNINRHRDSV